MAGVLVQNGKASFVDANGRPLAGGKVYFYAVGTNTLKDTFQDDQLTILNTNPVVLDARGEASIYGSGAYRQVLRDASNVLIWDQVIPDISAVVNASVITLTNSVTDLYNWSGYEVYGIREMLALDTSKFFVCFCLSYFSNLFVPFVGGGAFYWAPSMPKSMHDGGSTFSPTVPWNGAMNTLPAFLAGTGETNPAGSGCWVRVDQTSIDATMFGAAPFAGYNNIYSIQKAIDTFRVVKIPLGVFEFTGTLNFNLDGVNIIGANMKYTVLQCLNTSEPAIQNPLKNTTTRLFCGIQNLQIQGQSLGPNLIVDWMSFQFGRIHKVWILGSNALGNTGLRMMSNWVVTECTYNSVDECYIGNTAVGISISDGANNNNITRSRFQSSVATGQGILLSGTAPNRVSVVNITGNGFEYPGTINDGINVLQNCDSVHISQNRFESLRNGIVVGAIGNTNISGIGRTSNYFSSCTTNINLSNGAVGAKGDIVAAGNFNGTSNAFFGQPYGFTYTRTGVGTYDFVYTDATYPDTGQVIGVSVTTSKFAVTQSLTGFTLLCQNDAGVNTDSAFVAVTVHYNR